ncbi:MAG: hypothetical protein QOF38_5128 [Pseudonocardiales bacterium]|nr:hypothetical protein [Pseudonocardiales bacterium]
MKFNKEATRWLGDWMDAHLTFKEHHNRCIKKAKAAEACLRSLKKTYGVVPAGVREDRIARFVAWLADACEGSKLKELHDYPTSGAPICRVVKKQHKRSRTAESMGWPDPGRRQQSRL